MTLKSHRADTHMNNGIDIIGDIHGNASLLIELLLKLGYEHHGHAFAHPRRRIIGFTGDLVVPLRGRPS